MELSAVLTFDISGDRIVCHLENLDFRWQVLVVVIQAVVVQAVAVAAQAVEVTEVVEGSASARRLRGLSLC